MWLKGKSGGHIFFFKSVCFMKQGIDLEYNWLEDGIRTTGVKMESLDRPCVTKNGY